jgi:hypothetical protein
MVGSFRSGPTDQVERCCESHQPAKRQGVHGTSPQSIMALTFSANQQFSGAPVHIVESDCHDLGLP